MTPAMTLGELTRLRPCRPGGGGPLLLLVALLGLVLAPVVNAQGLDPSRLRDLIPGLGGGKSGSRSALTTSTIKSELRKAVRAFRQEDYEKGEEIIRDVGTRAEMYGAPDDQVEMLRELRKLGRAVRGEDRDLAYCRMTLRLAEAGSSKTSLDILPELNQIGGLHESRKQFPESERYYRRAHDLLEKAFEPPPLDVARAAANLARVLRNQGRMGEAEPLLKKALDQLEKAPSTDAALEGEVKHAVGSLLLERREFAKAEPLYRRVYELLSKDPNVEMVRMAGVIGDLGVILSGLGKSEEARTFLLKGLEMIEKGKAPDPASKRDLLRGLAGVHLQEGHPEEALPLLEQVLKMVSGDPKAPQGYRTEVLSDLAEAAREAGHTAAAEEYTQQLLDQAASEGASNSRGVAQALVRAGALAIDRGQDSRGRDLYQRALAVLSGVEGAEDLQAQALQELALLDNLSGEVDRAQEKFEKAVALLESQASPDPTMLGILHSDLASLYVEKGDLDAAEARATRAEKLLQEVGGIELSVALATHALIEFERKRPKGALEWIEKSIKVLEDAGLRKSEPMYRALHDAGVYQEDMKQYAGAEQSYRRALEIGQEEKLFDEGDEQLRATLMGLANVLRAQGKEDEALELDMKLDPEGFAGSEDDEGEGEGEEEGREDEGEAESEGDEDPQEAKTPTPVEGEEARDGAESSGPDAPAGPAEAEAEAE